MSTGRRREALALTAALLCLSALPGCGSERTFTAEGVIHDLNQRGAGIALGAPLESSRPGVEVYSLGFASSGATGPAGTGGAAGSAAGSLLVTPSSDAGTSEYQRCEGSTGLICFRVANVVLVLEGAVPPDAMSRLTVAVQNIAG